MIDREEYDKMMKDLVLGSNSGDTDLNSLMDFVLSVQYYTMEETIAKLSDRLMPAPERTCRNLSAFQNLHCFICSNCGNSCYCEPSYCPNCGAKVVEQ